MIQTALASACRLVCGPTVEWRCDSHADVQRIYFANHSSHLDFIVIWSALPPRVRRLARPVAGSDYWRKDVVRRFLAGRVFDAVLIERPSAGAQTSVNGARVSIERMAGAMGDRYSLIVFPEGTRSVNGEIGPFKSGLYHLWRLRPDVHLIPVHLENLNRVLPKGEALPVPMLSRVVFGPRLHTDANQPKDDFLAKARAAVLELKGAP
jgi:1-acyl-sn-glycerol-3-phosphate acyltransferase